VQRCRVVDATEVNYTRTCSWCGVVNNSVDASKVFCSVNEHCKVFCSVNEHCGGHSREQPC
jgi:hypothetical protein